MCVYRMTQTEVGASGSSVFVKAWQVVSGRTSSWPWWASSSWWGRKSVAWWCLYASRYCTISSATAMSNPNPVVVHVFYTV